MKNLPLKITGGLMLTILLGSLYLNQRRKTQDKLARKVLREVIRIVNPATQGLVAEDAFDTGYLDKLLQKVGSKVIVMKESAAVRTAEMIHDAWSFWGDDEEKVNSAFRMLKDKVQVSQVARAYQNLYDIHLIDKLNDRMDEDQIKAVLFIVSNLPPYRTLNQ